MSKKKSKKKNPKLEQAKVDSRRNIKKKIRKDMDLMYQKNSRIDKGDIKSRFLTIHPGESGFISQVVGDYTASLQKRNVKQELKGKGKDVAHQTDDSAMASRPSGSLRSSAKPAVQDNSEPNSDIDRGEPDAIILRDFREYLDVNRGVSSRRRPTVSCSSSVVPALEQQMRFLNLTSQEDRCAGGQVSHNTEESVLLSPALTHLGHGMPSQFALLGHLASSPPAAGLPDPRVMLNTNAPFSAFICGLQGSGKSHTTSCIIENCTLSSSTLGTLRKPLSTLVLHFNEYSSNVSSQPSEAAFIASVKPEYSSLQHSIPVRVLVSPSNLHTLEKIYSQIPNVRVLPFRLQPRHLNVSAMLSLMSLSKNDSIPLYMAQVTRVLREMAVNGRSFDYLDFRSRLNSLALDRTQTSFLDQRLDLLDSFLDLKGESGGDYFVDGGVTILDLSCPFVDRSTACILFRIAIDLFLHGHPSRGKVIVADEAHKYITESSAANALTETFLDIVRRQRHLGARLIISTQEPTVSPKLIDLCSITIIHRFSSPEWYRTVRKHIALGDEAKNGSGEDGLHQISSLRTGEALVFAPSAYLLDGNRSVVDAKHESVQMVVRKRITWDGGQTIVCIR